MPLNSSAYLLVSHGSRDPRPEIAIAQLTESVSHQLKERGIPNPFVKAAVLECAPTSLHEQIQAFAESALAANPALTTIYLLPLFLVPGVHVMEDIPAEVAIAQQSLKDSGSSIDLEICPYLGTDSQLYQLLSAEKSVGVAQILMSHGSRRAGGNAPVEAIAAHLNATAAYWSVEPKLETQVKQVAEQGYIEIVILPYFLFEGGITDAIAQTVNQLAEEYCAVRLSMAKTLGANPELATHIVSLFP